MKWIKTIFICSFILLSNSACSTKAVHVHLKVIDNNQQAVENAKVAMGFLLSKGSNLFNGLTNAKGIVDTTNRGTFGVAILIRKEGYYESTYRTGYGDQDLTLLLREKKNPIAMYAKETKIISPVFDQEYGYDLMKGDYVNPYGQGEIADLVIKTHYKKKDFWNYDYYLSIGFSNPYDGLLPFLIEHHESKYQSNYLAPETPYQNLWKFKRIKKTDTPTDTNFNAKQNYYLRVRTRVNDKGEIESAHYGKIYGEFPQLMYYINPTPNDRNIEFDLKKNLFKNLPSRERILNP